MSYLLSFLCFVSAQSAYFYRDTKSLFPSGYLPTSKLEKKITERKDEYWQRLMFGEKYYWVSTDQVWHQKDLFGHVILERPEILRSSPSFKGAPSKHLAKGLHPVCDRKGDWIQICEKGWIQSPFLQWPKKLEGSYGYTYRSTHLLKKANLLFPLQLLPAKQKIKILKQSGNFYEVEALGQKAFIQKDDVLSINDFKDTNVYLPDIVVNAKVNLFDSSSQSLKGETFVHGLEERKVEWFKTFVAGHGSVWWREEHETKKEDSPLYHVKEIMSRKVFDIAKHPAKNLTVVAADGIFRSFDGLTWEQIETFSNKNLAVAFSPEGDLYVGDFRSFDMGQKFERYLRWDQIMKTLNIKADFKEFGIHEISFKDGLILLKIKYHQKDYFIASGDKGKTWLRHEPAQNIIDHL